MQYLDCELFEQISEKRQDWILFTSFARTIRIPTNLPNFRPCGSSKPPASTAESSVIITVLSLLHLIPEHDISLSTQSIVKPTKFCITVNERCICINTWFPVRSRLHQRSKLGSSNFLFPIIIKECTYSMRSLLTKNLKSTRNSK